MVSVSFQMFYNPGLPLIWYGWRNKFCKWKTYKFIGFSDVQKPYKFIWLSDDDQKPYKFIGFSDARKPYEFIGFSIIMSKNPMNS